MKRLALLIMAVMILPYGCVTQSTFVLTGKQHPALEKGAEVNLIAWGKKGQYEAIGIADIGGFKLEDRVKEARRIARINGGDTIMPKGLSDLADTKDIPQEYMIQSFLVLKKIEKEMDDAGGNKDVVSKDDGTGDKKTDPSKMSQNDYKNLPRATYKLLVDDIKSLKGEMFQGMLYPKSYYRVPRSLNAHTGKEKRLLMLSTRSGRYKLFLIVPKEKTKKFRNMIRSRQKLSFVYSPITVYRSGKGRYPVLEYIDEIEE